MNANDLSKEALFDLVVQYKNIIEQQADRIAELEKELDERFKAGKALGYAEGLASMSGMVIKGSAL